MMTVIYVENFIKSLSLLFIGSLSRELRRPNWIVFG
jgi:hypothetical protein